MNETLKVEATQQASINPCHEFDTTMDSLSAEDPNTARLASLAKLMTPEQRQAKITTLQSLIKSNVDYLERLTEGRIERPEDSLFTTSSLEKLWQTRLAQKELALEVLSQ